jgi:hypothetical protein
LQLGLILLSLQQSIQNLSQQTSLCSQSAYQARRQDKIHRMLQLLLFLESIIKTCNVRIWFSCLIQINSQGPKNNTNFTYQILSIIILASISGLKSPTNCIIPQAISRSRLCYSLTSNV